MKEEIQNFAVDLLSLIKEFAPNMTKALDICSCITNVHRLRVKRILSVALFYKWAYKCGSALNFNVIYDALIRHFSAQNALRTVFIVFIHACEHERLKTSLPSEA